MLFVDEFCGILVYIKFGADVTSQYDYKALFQKIGAYDGAVMIEVYDGCYREAAELIESYQWLKKTIMQ